MSDVGKALILFGAVIIVIGGALLLAGKLNLPLGRLPGDISWRNKSGNTSVYFPVVTCLVVSIVLSLVFWLMSLLRK